MAKVVQFSIKKKPRKHLEVSFLMESIMKQMINQVNQLSFHLLQLRISKDKNMEMDFSTIQCYNCWEMGHYSRVCLNLLALPTKENVGSFTWRFFTKEKGKFQIQLIEPMSEGREKAYMGLERSFKILEDVVDVMAQTKWPMENTIHLDTNI